MQMTNLPEDSVVVTPSNVTDYAAGTANGFIVGVAGIVMVVHRPGGDPKPWPAAAGFPIGCRHIRINVTGTTATGIMALY